MKYFGLELYPTLFNYLDMINTGVSYNSGNHKQRSNMYVVRLGGATTFEENFGEAASIDIGLTFTIYKVC